MQLWFNSFFLVIPVEVKTVLNICDYGLFYFSSYTSRSKDRWLEVYSRIQIKCQPDFRKNISSDTWKR